MKIGIFADVHGNLFAFENIYRELKKDSLFGEEKNATNNTKQDRFRCFGTRALNPGDFSLASSIAGSFDFSD